MTRKDYELVAKALNMRNWYDEFGNVTNDHAIETRNNIARALAEALALDNPRFDRDKFLKACRVAQ
jgi:hypothetical protein